MSDPTDPTPEHPEPAAHPGTPRESAAEESDGQVSETGGLNREPISDGDTVVGSTTADDGGQPDPGAVGPDGVPPENRRDNDFKKPDAEHRVDEKVDDA
ncbi:hypothetical protein SAMN04487968_101537 [Nocardioides terrae]|uniref:Uncharacterized protein n=1 Tax=Nocardioides terrae TaxID=574651 RepID=A0A1I1E2T5_9ACTN|nr:hypothetical protein [Nocardioides terrae]SFB79250.1 hypothetical protein SAMN04487968_101537 [Nocardioides terrae]